MTAFPASTRTPAHRTAFVVARMAAAFLALLIATLLSGRPVAAQEQCAEIAPGDDIRFE